MSQEIIWVPKHWSCSNSSNSKEKIDKATQTDKNPIMNSSIFGYQKEKENEVTTWKPVGADPIFRGPKARDLQRRSRCCYCYLFAPQWKGLLPQWEVPEDESDGSEPGGQRWRSMLPPRTSAPASKTTSFLPPCLTELANFSDLFELLKHFHDVP